MAYRVPRRFIAPPDDPPPYGLLVLSLVGHAFFLLMATALSAYVSARLDESKVYIVNLVPTAPPAGSPTPRAVKRPPVERPAKEPEAPRARPAAEASPPKPKTPEAPPPRREPKAPEPPPRVARAPEPPPTRAVAMRPAETPTPPSPAELALPRKAQKEPPALDTAATRARLTERTPVPPPPRPAPGPTTPPPARAPEPPPRVVTPPPPTVPVAAPALQPPQAVVASTPGTEPLRLGRPDSATSTGSISLDVTDFPFTYYLRQVQAKISERWAPPRAAAIGGERVVIMFEIGRDGQIREPTLEHQSGNALYDQSALRAVVEASPFPPLPPEFKASSLRVHFGFEFRPEQG